MAHYEKDSLQKMLDRLTSGKNGNNQPAQQAQTTQQTQQAPKEKPAGANIPPTLPLYKPVHK